MLRLDRADEAIDYLQQARRVFAEIKEADGAGYASYTLARCYLSLGRDGEALDCLRQALGSHEASGNRQRQAVTLRLLGRTLIRTGLAAEAHKSWTQAAAIFDDLGDTAQAAEVRAEHVASGIS
jgi:tetratricopeptide (TPR) repeat protein